MSNTCKICDTEILPKIGCKCEQAATKHHAAMQQVNPVENLEIENRLLKLSHNQISEGLEYVAKAIETHDNLDREYWAKAVRKIIDNAKNITK